MLLLRGNFECLQLLPCATYLDKVPLIINQNPPSASHSKSCSLLNLPIAHRPNFALAFFNMHALGSVVPSSVIEAIEEARLDDDRSEGILGHFGMVEAKAEVCTTDGDGEREGLQG